MQSQPQERSGQLLARNVMKTPNLQQLVLVSPEKLLIVKYRTKIHIRSFHWQRKQSKNIVETQFQSEGSIFY